MGKNFPAKFFTSCSEKFFAFFFFTKKFLPITEHL